MRGRPRLTVFEGQHDQGSELLSRVSAVIPSYNGCRVLRRALRVLREAAEEVEVIVIDGASVDGSPEMVRREFPEVRLLEHDNHGWAHATNRGIEAASGEYLLLMNSDLFITREALLAMVRRLRAKAHLGAVGPRLLNEDGSRQHLFGPFYMPNWLPGDRTHEVNVLSGACILTRRDVLLDIGGMDENFFFYNEETDWCTRARRAGYRLELLPEEVVHVGGGSTRPSPNMLLETRRNLLYLAQKHWPSQVVSVLRRSMQVEGYCWSRVDPRPDYRTMWSRLHTLATDKAYLDSPFSLSGRGMTAGRPVAGRAVTGRPAMTERAPASEPAPAGARRNGRLAPGAEKKEESAPHRVPWIEDPGQTRTA